MWPARRRRRVHLPAGAISVTTGVPELEVSRSSCANWPAGRVNVSPSTAAAAPS